MIFHPPSWTPLSMLASLCLSSGLCSCLWLVITYLMKRIFYPPSWTPPWMLASLHLLASWPSNRRRPPLPWWGDRPKRITNSFPSINQLVNYVKPVNVVDTLLSYICYPKVVHLLSQNNFTLLSYICYPKGKPEVVWCDVLPCEAVFRSRKEVHRVNHLQTQPFKT